jgi:FixJ family two-component response regulator
MLNSNNFPIRQPIIYLVDHDENSLASLATLFAPLDAKIKCFTSAESFLSHGHSKDKACLLIEAHLQEVSQSGIVLLESMVRQGQQIPTIVLANLSDIPTAVRAMQASAIDFIEKPYVEHILLMKVNTLLHQCLNGALTML